MTQKHIATATKRPVSAVATRKGCCSMSFTLLISQGRNDGRIYSRNSVVQSHKATATKRPVSAVATRKGCCSMSFTLIDKLGTQRVSKSRAIQRRTNPQRHSHKAPRTRGCHPKGLLLYVTHPY